MSPLAHICDVRLYPGVSYCSLLNEAITGRPQVSKIPGDDQILWFRRMWLEKLLIFLCVFDTSPKHRLQSHGSAKRFSLQEHSHLGFLQHVPAHLQKNDGQKGSAGAPQRLLYGHGGGRFIKICPYINVAPKLPNVNIQIDPFATLVPKCQYSDRSIRNIGTQITKCQYSDRSICNIGTQITKCQYSDRSICNIGTQMSIFGSDPFAIRLAGAAIRI